MLLTTLVSASSQVAATASRLAKRALLAGVLEAADPGEIALVATYLSGSLRQRRPGVGWVGLQVTPEPAATATLSVNAVDRALEVLELEHGEGSTARRAAGIAALFEAATRPEQEFLRAIITGELRQGASASLVQDALAAAYAVPLASVQRAAMLSGSLATAATLVASGGQAALEAVQLQVGTAVAPMLAASAPDTAAATAKVGLPAIVDVKIDGIRVQAHRWQDADGVARVRLFTRSLDDITDRLPQIVEQVEALPGTSLVLDGEIVGLRADGTPLPFQVIASAAATSSETQTARTRVPLTLVVFDALHVDGVDLLDEPFAVRNAALTQLLPPDRQVERHIVSTAAKVEELFQRAVAQRWEGVVIKKPQAPYAAGRRDSSWIKVKPRHTFDLAVIAAEWGYGRRTGKLSNLHLAARDSSTGELVMLGKTFKGLTDATLAWQTQELERREVRRTTTTVFVDPPLVAEIAIDGVQLSSRYPGGIALRFARVLRYRDDLGPGEVDTLADVLALSPVIDE